MSEPGRSPHRISWRDLGAIALLAVGLLQMMGDASGIVALKGIGAATAASPLPKVFSDVRGLEPFASRFTLLVTDAAGAETAREITPQLYGRLGGPYNRRNVYGAALSYAPRLPEPLWRSVYCYGLGPGGPLRRNFGVPDDAARVRVAIATRTRGRTDAWVLEAACGG
jgi:hypothetical protein